MLIYLIRHGETDYNLTHRFQGMWVESHLTETGKAQARAASALLKDVPFDRLFVSAAERTRETAALLFPDRNDAVFDDDLREINVGWIADLYVADIREKHGEEYANAVRTRDYSFFGGETLEEHKARARRAMDKVLASGGETVAVVSHGGTIRCLLWALTGIEPSATALLPNCSYAAIEIKDGKGVLKQFGLVPLQASSHEAY